MAKGMHESSWTFDSTPAGPAPRPLREVMPRGVPLDGEAFAKNLHVRAMMHEAREAAVRRAPPEVTHRRVDGVTVLSSRLWAGRTNHTPTGSARRHAFQPRTYTVGGWPE